MTNQFARFHHTSPLSSIAHDPPITLASNVIRDSFGPMVQLVADCLQARGGQSTLSQILGTIQTQSHKKSMATFVDLDLDLKQQQQAKKDESRTEERRQILRVSQLRPIASRDAPSIPAIRAALITLIQHSIVTVTKKKTKVPRKTTATASAPTTKTITVYLYEFHHDRARLIVRYPRFVEYTKKALDETAAALVEELLVQGRMQTVNAIVSTVEQLQQIKETTTTSDSANNSTMDSNATSSSRYTFRQAVLESFRRLVAGGCIQQVPAMVDLSREDEEVEFADDNAAAPPPAKRQRIQSASSSHSDPEATTGGGGGGADDADDPAVVALLQSGAYRSLPRDAIWRVNVRMFHDSLRAVSLGWLVAERYGPKVQAAGSIVTAALKLGAYREHAESSSPLATSASLDFEARYYFKPEDITRYLPKTVLQTFEKKPNGVIPNLFKSLKELSVGCTKPVVVNQVEEVGDNGPMGQAKFQIETRKLVAYLQDRIFHQMIFDSHGEVAARICSILAVHGHMESDALAEAAMVPAKDTREVLHRLYRDDYVELFNLNQGKQHNPNTMIYLWFISRTKSLRVATDNACTALLHIRLRRQHEVEVGRDWIERAKEAGATDENENEADKVNYTRFCQGLERLDNAALQLDETLMVLKDY